MISIEFKKCPRCKLDFPRTTKFFHRDRRRIDGLNSACKECRCKKRKEQYNKQKENRISHKWYLKNKESHLRKNRNMEKEFQLQHGFSYGGLHCFIRSNKPKQVYCTICNEIVELQLASIDHTYTRNIEDWLWLCQSCHSQFDKLRKVMIVGYS